MSPEAPLQQSPSVGTDDLAVELLTNGVAVVEIRRPPNNFFDVSLIEAIAAALDTLITQTEARTVVLASHGKHFCAGADFAGTTGAAEIDPDEGAKALYEAGARIFESELPIVAAVQGAAVGGGLGLALAADFRVAGPSSRFSANFSRLGLHHGFGLTETLPRVIGQQRALELLTTGRRVKGEEAHAIGLVDRFVDDDQIRSAAVGLATEIGSAAPLAVRSIRATMRAGLAEAVRRATAHERAEQARLRATDDFAEGIRAAAERREPKFTAR